MIKILLADDHPLFTEGVKSFLQMEKEIKIVGEAANQQEVLAIMKKESVDIVLLDVRFPTDKEGEATCKALKKKYPKTKVLMVTMHNQAERKKMFWNYNADGYVLKESSKDKLIGAIHSVYSNGSFWSLEDLDEIRKHTTSTEEEIHLTEAELTVLNLLNQGMTAQEAADQLNLAVHTVRTHAGNMRKKAGVSNLVALVNFARNRGFIS